jgi:hypothetical protein
LVLVAFVVTLPAGLAARFGAHRFIAADLLNVWFIVAWQSRTATSVGTPPPTPGLSQWPGSLGRRSGSRCRSSLGWYWAGARTVHNPVAELPGEVTPRKLTRPLIVFSVIRALAIAITVAIAFGLDLEHADWTPIAAVVAMKPNLDEAKLTSEQRLIGAFIGAVLAALLLLRVDNEHALELITIGFLTLAFALRFANCALYCAAMAAAVLIALDLPDPSNFTAEAERVLFTFIGLGIGLLVMLWAGLVAKRAAKPPTTTASQPV